MHLIQKHFLFISLITVVVMSFSCKDKKETQESTCLLYSTNTSLEYLDSNLIETSSTKYEYNADKDIKVINSYKDGAYFSTLNFYYDSLGLLQSSEERRPDQTDFTQICDYVYKDSKMIRIQELGHTYDENSNATYYVLYTHLIFENEKLDSINYDYIIIGDLNTQWAITDVLWENENAKEYTLTNDSNSVDVIATYDEYNNYRKGFTKPGRGIKLISYLCKNNLTLLTAASSNTALGISEGDTLIFNTLEFNGKSELLMLTEEATVFNNNIGKETIFNWSCD